MSGEDNWQPAREKARPGLEKKKVNKIAKSRSTNGKIKKGIVKINTTDETKHHQYVAV